MRSIAALTLAAVCLAVRSAAPPPARAEGKGSPGGDWKAACGDDVDRFCSGAPNPGMCLHEHWDELSPSCRALKEGMKKKWEKEHPDPMKQACGADVERLCAGSDRPGMCLHEHWEEVSQGCRDFKEGMRKRWSDDKPDPMKQACGEDAKRLCAGSEKPGGCLHEHWEELSQGCRDYKESMKKRWDKPKKGDGEKAWKEGKSSEDAQAPAPEKKGRMRFEWTEKKGEADKDAGTKGD